MKKSYMNPAMQVVRIETHKMLAESTQDVGIGEGTKPGGAACSRDFSFGDEE